MKMITKTLEKQIPRIGAIQFVENPKAIIHYFNPFGSGDWYVLEGEKQENGDWLFFGYVKSPLDPLFDEYGYFTLSELESVKIIGDYGIERDLYWTQTPIKEIIGVN